MSRLPLKKTGSRKYVRDGRRFSAIVLYKQVVGNGTFPNNWIAIPHSKFANRDGRWSWRSRTLSFKPCPPISPYIIFLISCPSTQRVSNLPHEPLGFSSNPPWYSFGNLSNPHSWRILQQKSTENMSMLATHLGCHQCHPSAIIRPFLPGQEGESKRQTVEVKCSTLILWRWRMGMATRLPKKREPYLLNRLVNYDLRVFFSASKRGVKLWINMNKPFILYIYWLM